MKKEVLASAILLMSPASYLSAHELADARARVSVKRQNMIDDRFLGATILTDIFTIPTPDGNWTQKTYDYRLRVSFAKANDYSFDGHGQMEYEMIVEKVALDGTLLPSDDKYYFVQRTDENSFKAYDCDSTKRCEKDDNNAIFHIFETPSGKILKFKNSSVKGYLMLTAGGIFHEVK